MTDFALTGRIALVTGAGRGLGLEIARGLVQAGALVILNGRDSERLDAALAKLAADAVSGSAEAMAFDVANPHAVEIAFRTIAERHGRLDILVNNVGLRDRRDLFAFELEAVRRLLEADLVAPFNLSRRAAKLMADGGRIINVTSVAGPLAGQGDAVYTAAKGGLAALTRALAAELGRFGINVNAIAPGFFVTEANADLVEDRGILDWLHGRTSLGRWGNPREIAGAAVFLASPASSYVTGHILAVDGGLLAHM